MTGWPQAETVSGCSECSAWAIRNDQFPGRNVRGSGNGAPGRNGSRDWALRRLEFGADLRDVTDDVAQRVAEQKTAREDAGEKSSLSRLRGQFSFELSCRRNGAELVPAYEVDLDIQASGGDS